MVKKTKPLPKSYEAALEELQQILARLESGDLPLDAMLADYERAMQLLQFCRSSLAAVEQQVKLIQGDNAEPLDVTQL